MKDIIDLVIIGAGPAGLMAAKTASELGLQVVVVEMKKDLSKIKRSCSSQFVMDKGYENETIKIAGSNIIFCRNKFGINYTGKLLNITDNYYHSPSGHKIHFAHEDHKPFAIKFDKGHLLKDLWKDCQKSGVELKLEHIAYNGQDMGDYVRVDLKNHENYYSINARKLIIAEGANAKLTGKFGLNKDRKLFGMPFVLSYTIEGTNGFAPHSWNQFYSSKYHPFAEIIVESTLDGNDAVEVTITGNKEIRPDDIFHNLIKNSPMRHYFSKSHVIDKKGCALKSYASIKKPYCGNVIAIGDSSAHVEVIVQGALMCGYHAAHAVKAELSHKDGFKAYAKWWNKSFEFNKNNTTDFLKLYGSLALRPAYTDEELDYLFSLLEDRTLSGNFNQYEVPKTLWNELLVYKDKIKIEKPLLYDKIKNITTTIK